MESNDYNTNTTIKNTISTYIIPINFQKKKYQQYTLNLAILLIEDNYFLFRYKVTGAVLFENFD